MKKIFIVTALLLTAGVLQAQTTKEETKATQHKNIYARTPFADINLSDEQKAKIKELNADYHKQFSELRKNNNMTVGDYRAKTEALKKEQHEKIQSLLTPEQKTQMAAQRKNGQQKMKEAQAKRFDKMKSQLGLTDEQSKKLKESRAGFQDKLKNIREDKTLSESQKREQVKAISKQQHEQMKSVLTPEQLQKMKNGRKNKTVQSEK